MRRLRALVLAAALCAACRPSQAAPHADPIAGAIAGMAFGLTDLHEAAGTGDPIALRQAEREVLQPLLAGLEGCLVDGRVDARRYRRLYDEVGRVQGMFKEIPYRLEVRPGGALPAFTLELRRSPLPVLRAMRLHWRVVPIDGGARLLPPLAGGSRAR